MKVVTGIAPVNIAVIKYWGKRNETLILPVNDSISCTLDTDFMCAKTTVMASPTFAENKFWLNNKEVTFDNERLNNCLLEVKKRADPNCADLLNWKLHICSENNFPTAAGLASSAAGYACLVSTLAALYRVEGDISAIARRGSGSACRSVYGGFVQWHAGVQPGGEDSIAAQIAPRSHWPQMRVVILIQSYDQKKDSSTGGMRRSVETSKLLKYRAEGVVPERVKDMIGAIRNRDFGAFAEITMKDSNQFHAVAMDTYPPCFYMNDMSRSIVELIHAYNEYKGATKVAYTFDAGSNACLYLLEENVDEVVSLVNEAYPINFLKGLPIKRTPCPDLLKALNLETGSRGKCLISAIHTSLGDGPKILTDTSEHLLTENGLLKNSQI